MRCDVGLTGCSVCTHPSLCSCWRKCKPTENTKCGSNRMQKRQSRSPFFQLCYVAEYTFFSVLHSFFFLLLKKRAREQTTKKNDNRNKIIFFHVVSHCLCDVCLIFFSCYQVWFSFFSSFSFESYNYTFKREFFISNVAEQDKKNKLQ